MNKRVSVLFFAASLLILGSCAKEVNESDDQVEQRCLNAYIIENYGDGTQPKASGLYFFPQLPQHEGPSPVAGNYVYIDYTSRNLDESIIQTNSDSLQKMLGTDSKYVYYGPILSSMAAGQGMVGLQEALSYMHVGDMARAIIPSWLSVHTSGGNEAFSAPRIYDLKLLRIITDLAAYQTDSLQGFSLHRYGGIDSSKYDWYYSPLNTVTGETAGVGDTLKVVYAGYLLDGFLFDTNIKDTAKMYYGRDIDVTKTYDTLSVIMKEKVTEMSYVQGFSYALKEMREGEEAVTFFSSDYGYGSTGSGQIPAYAMLRFYLKVARIGRVVAQ